MKRLLILIPILLIVLLVSLIFFTAAHTVLEVKSPPTAIGDATPIIVRVTNPHGAKLVTASIAQDGKSSTITADTQKPHRLGLFKHEPSRDISFLAGRKNFPALHDGKATVTITAQSNDLIGHTDSTSFEVTVVTAPPRVVADGVQHYINQAGAEMVTFTTTGYVTESGVQVGSRRFRSFPLPGDPTRRVSLFALAWDQPVDSAPFVYATNPTGATAKATFWYKTFPKPFRTRDIEVTDAFMQKVVDEMDPNGTGDMVERFLRCNRDMRVRNSKQLVEIGKDTDDHFTWNKPFFADLGAREAMFADRRNYMYKGKKIDEQVHLGFDIAGTQHMPILAANDGRVVWADNLGIYGNCVVIDHGLGLQTIYGHMSEMLVKKGDIVKREQVIGKTGMTGMAGGDHLHFSMQVDGVQVNPVEWWDEHWIHDRIWSKVPPAAPAAK